ncbi:MAG TPA: restriction endonuclease FokI C-terminal domain-containing protein [Spirochaetales bacterium]|nr:restriction endonuclease FokI C-terminal domain-containing protein [Spirochaetales bacterium]HRY55087.1 restriction endonuclease FokI C-terminal domain-containing protein [Spirochaetia bacterium]HRZ64937.1 restriction endonuclease FokI C-terminal domain-containing protein [Spirochaetia bacterium]
MFGEEQQRKILDIWRDYSRSDKTIIDAKGNAVPDIDSQREEALPALRGLLNDFLGGSMEIGSFKSSIDSFNKRNNLWGFTATKGQMFFNQLAKAGASDLAALVGILKSALALPQGLDGALAKVEELAAYCKVHFDKAADKRTAPNPGSVCYFLSYFWQVQDRLAWPIMYSSLIEALDALGVWEPSESPRADYERFYRVNADIEELIGSGGGAKPSHWEIEHAFWRFIRRPGASTRPSQPRQGRGQAPAPEAAPVRPTPAEGSIVLADYLIPRIAGLVELGADTENSGARKGYIFEQMTAEAFQLLDFETTSLGQGRGRNPDFIARSREESSAFIVDAKAYSEGYSLGRDDRAMREYIATHCPRLRSDGYKKVGFIVVSNSFKDDLEDLAVELTWETDIKRFILLETEALLYLLAYKTRNRLRASDIIAFLVSMTNPIGKADIIGKFDDW